MNARTVTRNEGLGLDTTNLDTNRLETTTIPAATAQDASVGSLLKALAHAVPSLLSKEVALAKSEARESLHATKVGVAAVSVGGAVAVSGFIVLLLAAVYALSTVLAPWLAALIVGGITLVVGLVMVEAGKKKFAASSLKPDHTMDSLHKDKTAIQGRTP